VKGGKGEGSNLRERGEKLKKRRPSNSLPLKIGGEGGEGERGKSYPKSLYLKMEKREKKEGGELEKGGGKGRRGREFHHASPRGGGEGNQTGKGGEKEHLQFLSIPLKGKEKKGREETGLFL